MILKAKTYTNALVVVVSSAAYERSTCVRISGFGLRASGFDLVAGVGCGGWDARFAALGLGALGFRALGL